MTLHAYVDESRRSSYLLVATLLLPGRLAETRVLMRGLLLRGERRVHFQAERDARRREIVARLVAADLRTRVYESSGRAEPARAAALTRLTDDLVKLDARRLVLESRGRAADRLDRQVIARALGDSGVPADLGYGHLLPHEEPVLWVSDAVAWCVGAGGDWRRRVLPLIEDLTRVEA